MIRELMHNPKFLSQKSVPATPKDSAVFTDLLDTLNSHRDDCVGMAANMIGIKKNVIAVNIGLVNMLMVNPEIISCSGPYMTSEGCLSYLGGPRPVRRYETIEVRYQDSKFNTYTKTFTGFTAQIIQHEVDHLKGILI